MHNNAVKEVCSYWTSKTYGGYPVTPHPIMCPVDESSAEVEEKLRSLATMTARKAQEPDNREALEELCFLISHCSRSRYLLSFVKCASSSCSHCKEHPVVATQVVEELRIFGGRIPSPRPSCVDTGHFATYMECLVDPSQNPSLDEHRPSFQAVIGRCLVGGCRYVFASQADGTRHQRLVHPSEQATTETSSEPKTHRCRAVVDGAVCGLTFSSAYYLRKHRQQSGHEVRRGRPTLQ